MYRPDKMIRFGFWLVPWLPAFLLAVWVHAAYFAAPVYISTAKLALHLHDSSSVVAVVPTEPPAASFHVTPALVVLLCVACSLLAGCALLLVGFFRRSKLSPNSASST